MRCIADTHYHVIRKRSTRGFEGAINSLHCAFCDFAVYKRLISKPRTSKSGLGRYNRMRAAMVAHLHEKHSDKLQENK